MLFLRSKQLDNNHPVRHSAILLQEALGKPIGYVQVRLFKNLRL